LKKSHRRFLIFLIPVLAALGVLWFAFAPMPKPRVGTPLHVAVEQPATVAPPIGEEQTQPPIAETPAPPPQEEAVPPPPVVKGRARIAIVIDDMGLDMKGSRRAVALPSAVTLSYMPYAKNLREQTRAAREAGHELLLHMPMEPLGSADPGPGALMVGLPPDELRRRLDAALASFAGFDGMNNHMGSKFTADRAGMELVMDELQPRHLFYLDSRTSIQTVGESTARQRGVPTIARDVFLDDDMSPKAVRAQLEQAERVARRKGRAVAIGHPHPATLQALEEWLPDAEKRGFVFVPIKDLVNQPPR
jgi:polysaccharide deacetylase 2 family uncharacterized protein YibQ